MAIVPPDPSGELKKLKIVIIFILWSVDYYHRLNKKEIEIVFHCNNCVQVDVEESSEDEVFVN